MYLSSSGAASFAAVSLFRESLLSRPPTILQQHGGSLRHELGSIIESCDSRQTTARRTAILAEPAVRSTKVPQLGRGALNNQLIIN